MRVLHQLSSFGSSNASMRVASEVSLRMKTACCICARSARLRRRCRSSLRRSSREDDARAVAVAAEDRLVQVALLDVRRRPVLGRRVAR
jgi:hypothetical protein